MLWTGAAASLISLGINIAQDSIEGMWWAIVPVALLNQNFSVTKVSQPQLQLVPPYSLATSLKGTCWQLRLPWLARLISDAPFYWHLHDFGHGHTASRYGIHWHAPFWLRRSSRTTSTNRGARRQTKPVLWANLAWRSGSHLWRAHSLLPLSSPTTCRRCASLQSSRSSLLS